MEDAARKKTAEGLATEATLGLNKLRQMKTGVVGKEVEYEDSHDDEHYSLPQRPTKGNSGGGCARPVPKAHIGSSLKSCFSVVMVKRTGSDLLQVGPLCECHVQQVGAV